MLACWEWRINPELYLQEEPVLNVNMFQCSCPQLEGRDLVQSRAAPLPRHFRAFAGHRRSHQAQHGGSHSRKRDVEAGKDLAALGKRAKAEPGKSLGWEGAEVPRGCGGHAEGMLCLLSSAAGGSTRRVPGAVGTPGCGKVRVSWDDPTVGSSRVSWGHCTASGWDTGV